ncbi:hypothetical protein [Zymomonas mobilis]|uniref:hypothetical protein n=1 Tax=Zymomonas mobilis TaxID=542 RepID=UPI001182473A|nr:hypothetical protein [Zymomonas mobilis]
MHLGGGQIYQGLGFKIISNHCLSDRNQEKLFTHPHRSWLLFVRSSLLFVKSSLFYQSLTLCLPCAIGLTIRPNNAAHPQLLPPSVSASLVYMPKKIILEPVMASSILRRQRYGWP